MAPNQQNVGGNEREPLLQSSRQDPENNGKPENIDFSDDDEENPKNWPRWKKLANTAVIAAMAVLSPLASSMFTPGIDQIAESLNATQDQVIGATTGFVIMLGIGPLILAPLSETFGRRILYLTCFTAFSLLQIPTALSPNVATLVACRTISGFFGSVGIANGGGTLSDMFNPSERAGVFGWYLLGPLLGPTLGPLFGGLIVERLNWRWVFWVLTIVCCLNTTLGFIFLRETYAPVILAGRCKKMEQEKGGQYTFSGQDTRPLSSKLFTSVQRPLRILFTQPMVFILAIYQAIIFATMYSMYTNFQDIYSSPPYKFSTTQVGLMYLPSGVGFLTAVLFLVPLIDKTYNGLAEKYGGDPQPEYRLPIANIGAILVPLSLFAFAWTVEYRDHIHWAVTILPTFFFGLGQVSIFNTVQNYYIDAFSKYAASAIAAGMVFRSFAGGVVPLLAPLLFKNLGYGWGWSVFGFLTLALAPSPYLFQRYGRYMRERFAIEL